MLTSRLITFCLLFVCVAVAQSLLWGARDDAAASSKAGPIPFIGIDTQPAGNADNGPLGTTDTCAGTTVGSEFTVDIVVRGIPAPVNNPPLGPPGVEDAGGLQAIVIELNYDPAVLQVVTSIPRPIDALRMIVSNSAAIPVDLTESATDANVDGKASIAIADLGADWVTQESGDGILARITFTAVAEGESSLFLSESVLFIHDIINDSYDISVLDDALVVVDDSSQNPCDADSDDDADGVHDDIDGTWNGASFVNESSAFSDYFTDQHLGGASYGHIVTRSNTVQITREVTPPRLLVSAPAVNGGGSVNVCVTATVLSMVSNGSMEVSCVDGATIKVLSGTTVARAGKLVANLPAGARVTVQTFQAGYSVANLSDSTASIQINNKSIAPGSTVDDRDNDGYISSLETYMGTSPTVACGAPNSWPPDLVYSNSINISDVLALKPVFNTSVPPTSTRLDLVQSGGINISDVLALKPVFNNTCTP